MSKIGNFSSQMCAMLGGFGDVAYCDILERCEQFQLKYLPSLVLFIVNVNVFAYQER